MALLAVAVVTAVAVIMIIQLPRVLMEKRMRVRTTRGVEAIFYSDLDEYSRYFHHTEDMVEI